MDSIINLPYYLDNKVREKGSNIYGVIKCEVMTIPHMKKVTIEKTSAYVLVDIVAYTSENMNAFVAGQLLTVVPRKYVDLINNEDIRLPVKLSNGTLKLTNKEQNGMLDYIEYLTWKKETVGSNWKVVPSDIQLLDDLENVDDQYLKDNDLLQIAKVILQASSDNWVYTYPVEIWDSYRKSTPNTPFIAKNPKHEDRVSCPLVFSERDKEKDFKGESTVVDGVFEIQSNSKPQKVTGVSIMEKQPILEPNNDSLEELFPLPKKVKRMQEEQEKTNENKENEQKLDSETRRSKKHAKGSEPVIETRFEFMGYPKEYKDLELVVKTATTKNDKIVSTLLSDIPNRIPKEQKNHPIYDLIKNNIYRHWNDRITENTVGELVVEAVKDEVYETFAKSIETQEKLYGKSIAKMSMSNELSLDKIAEMLAIEDNDKDYMTKIENSIFYVMSRKFEDVADYLFAKALGINEYSFKRIRYKLETQMGKNGVSVFHICEINPYLLTYFSEMKVDDIDKIALYFKTNLNDNKIKSLRGAILCREYLLSDTSYLGNTTIVKRNKMLYELEKGVRRSKTTFDNVKRTGKLLGYIQEKTASYILNGSINQETFEERKDFAVPSTLAYESYVKYGLGVELVFDGTVYITDYTLAFKEQYIYKKLKLILENKSNAIEYTEEDIEKIEEIQKEYEEEMDKKLGLPNGTFKLEKEQAEIKKIFSESVLCITGVGGSGKTTSVKFMVKLLEKFYPNKSVIFTAPTGRAASRMAEVVEKNVSTLHSQFSLGLDSVNISDRVDEKEIYSEAIVIIDEASFINLDNAYSIVSSLTTSTIVVFIGDVAQLPAIGRGKIFDTLLKFFPTLKLGVSKRAEAGSSIATNCNIVLNKDSEPLVNDSQSVIYDIKEKSKAIEYIRNIYEYITGKTDSLPNNLTPKIPRNGMNIENVQLVTPINGQEWGTRNLNKEIQDIVNPRDMDSVAFGYKNNTGDFSIEFRLNDKVVFTKNEKTKGHILLDGKGNLGVAKTQGVSNGDTGIIKSIISPKNLRLSELVGDYSEEDTKKGKENKLCDVLGIDSLDREYIEEINGTIRIVLIEIKTYNSEKKEMQKVYIPLVLKVKQNYGNYLEVAYKNIKAIDLGYALSTHKLQGSEADIIIGVLFSVGGDKSTFINNNMLYTIISRAKKQLFLVGDINGSSSAFEKGRRIRIMDRIETVGSNFKY